MQKAKQKGTMKDINTISTCLTDYLTDNGLAYDQNGTYTTGSAFYQAMSPFYVTVLPVNDQWGNAFYVYGRANVNNKYGVTNASNQDFLVASRGRDGNSEEGSDFVTQPGSGLFIVSGMAAFGYDLVQWNGNWIRGPQTRAGAAT